MCVCVCACVLCVCACVCVSELAAVVWLVVGGYGCGERSDARRGSGHGAMAGKTLKTAYRKLALSLHPGKCKLEGAEDAFKLLGRANDILSNSRKRQLYDVYGPERGQKGRQIPC